MLLAEINFDLKQEDVHSPTQLTEPSKDWWDSDYGISLLEDSQISTQWPVWLGNLIQS